MFLPRSVLDAASTVGRDVLRAMADAGLDHVGASDHVSFHGGWGIDGIVQATALAAAEPRLDVAIGVYLLPLRHPVTVARQLSTFSQLTGAALEFGVGVGGEDPHEYHVTGVDPTTRGRRMTESLTIVRALINGDTVDFDGEFFQLEQARITPKPSNITVTVGGRADAALHRAGTLADGWISAWVSPERFAERRTVVERAATETGRDPSTLRFGFQPWVGFGVDAAAARAAVARPVEAMYRLPFDRFERYSPHGTPQQVADALRPYVERGVTSFNVAAQSDDGWQRSVDGVAEVREILRAG
jgi:alkanesulfonate monooxygenase SsuD/methylene tetrahydromethanopterin reductase-like flavin-dependent oxidoreductase (luciferase family)